jgi:DnaJ-domain-containing protein 1
MGFFDKLKRLGPTPSLEKCVSCGKVFMTHTIKDRVCVSCRAYEEHEEPPTKLEEAYSILGVRLSDSDETVKRKFRALAKESHIDGLPSELPEYLVDAANERFRKVRDAYEIIMNHRGANHH